MRNKLFVFAITVILILSNLMVLFGAGIIDEENVIIKEETIIEKDKRIEENEEHFEIEIISPEDGAEFEKYDTVIIEYRVENTGDLTATQDIRFSIDGDLIQTVEDIELEEGETYVGEFEWEALDAGVYELEIMSDDTSDSISITVERKPSPDLMVHDLEFSEEEVRIGETVTISVEITNIGNSKAEAIETRLRVNGEPITIEEIIFYQEGEEMEINEIGEGETVTIEFEWEPTEEGENTVNVKVTDVEEPEDLRFDNEIEKTITIDPPLWREYIVYMPIPIIVGSIILALLLIKRKKKRAIEENKEVIENYLESIPKKFDEAERLGLNIEDEKSKFTDIRDEYNKKIEEEYFSQNNGSRLTSLEKELASINSKLDEAIKEEKKKRDKGSELIEKIEEKEKSIKKSFDEIESLISENKKLVTRIEDLKSRFKEASYDENKIESMEDSIEEYGEIEAELTEIRDSVEKAKKLENEIENLAEEEPNLDTREIEEAIKENDLDKAEKALEGLKEKYSEYKETIENLQSLDKRKSSLAQKLADDEIDRDTYNDAVQNIETEKADLEEKLNRLREEIIYEDYEKPF